MMIINIYFRNGVVISIDRVSEWKLSEEKIEWSQYSEAKVKLSNVIADEIIAVTREDVDDES